MTIKHVISAILLYGGSVWAATTPDYPVIYDPAVGGPVANPAYGKADARKTGEVACAKQTTTIPRYMNAANYELNLTLSYGFDATPGDRYACNMVGCEVEGAYYLTQHQALTLSLGFAGGGDTENYWVEGDGHYPGYPWTDSYDRYSVTLMGGYRYVQKIGRYCEVQVGAKCGMDVQILNTDFGLGWSDYDHDVLDDRGDTHAAVGFGYAGYVNLCFPISKNGYLLIGYQYRGSTAKPHAKYDIPGDPGMSGYRLDIQTHSMRWHEVRVGVSFNY